MKRSAKIRPRVWSRIREVASKGRDMRPVDIARDLETASENVTVYMAALARAGILEVTRIERGKNAAYRLIEDVGAVPPQLKRERGRFMAHPGQAKPSAKASSERKMRRVTMRALVWSLIRAFGERRASFCAKDVFCTVQASLSRATESGIYRYLRALEVGGYLSSRQDGKTLRYRVLHDTGPRHPVPRPGGIFDPNTGKFHSLEVAA